ncbi:MAG TPA: hypothetical protein VMJ10_27395 [Kofleriaceae bacterium]|nr:hypothetical protein [Kofleriaceae bacterium]
MKPAALAVLALGALAGCIDDHYACTADSDCNLGTGGRCELDHLCTQYDEACPLLRSYSPHSGDLSGQCYVEHTTLVDPCAAGQPPESPTGSYAGVCGPLPSCCSTGWSEPCVQLAQVQLQLHCDTRIAVTAWNHNPTVPNANVLYDVRLNGAQWQVTPNTRSTFLEWIAPAPNDAFGLPRLAGLDSPDATHLLVGEDPSPIAFTLLPGRTFDTLSSVDFDRSGRDLAMLSSNNIMQSPSDGIAHVVVDLTTGDARPLASELIAPLESWGDIDGDAFPDAIAETGSGASYHFVANTDDRSDHSRQIDDNAGTMAAGGDQPYIGAFGWYDLDGDKRLDLVEIGSQVAIHLAPSSGGPLPYVPTYKIDCEPPQVAGTCVNGQASTGIGFVGSIVPTSGGAIDIVVGVDNETLDTEATPQPTFRSRVLYLIQDAASSAPKSSIIAPTSSCIGTGMASSPKCPLYRAVVARDLDGDGVLDLVAIDNELEIYTFRGLGNEQYGPPTMQSLQPITGSPPTTYQYVRASVTGALIP